MRKFLCLLISVLALAGCSSPKYTYNFDYYDYNSGKKKATSNVVAKQFVQESVLVIDETTLVASANETEVYVAKPTPLTKAEAKAKLKSMSREEKNELKSELKKYVKESKKMNSLKESHNAKHMEEDLKLASILGAIGLVLVIIGGEALSIIGGIALLAGLFFLIRYLVNQ